MDRVAPIATTLEFPSVISTVSVLRFVIVVGILIAVVGNFIALTLAVRLFGLPQRFSCS